MRPGHRVIRVVAVLVLLAATGYVLRPHVVSYVATAAVVNAPVITVRSPFDGVVVDPSGPLSQPVDSGAVLLRLVTERSDRTVLAELRAQHTALTGEAGALRDHAARLETLSGQLHGRSENHVAHARAALEARQAEARARIDAARTTLSELRGETARSRRLAESGAVSRVAVVDAEAREAVSERLLAAEMARLDALRAATAALADEVAVDTVSDGLTQLLNRRGEIELRLAETEMRQATLAARGAALREQIAVLERRSRAQDSFLARATANGIIWKPSPPAGMPVLTGDELVRVLDCDRRFIEVAVPERHFERLKPGDPASIQLKGARERIAGRVEAVRGAGGRFDRPSLAAAVPQADDRQLSVIVGLPPARLSDPGIAASFCHVGRTADVRFARDTAQAWWNPAGWVARIGALAAAAPDPDGEIAPPSRR